ncbi:hypothetical protein EUGRSUZ_C03105 [Eucalyptus grandis]|uniref:Uncharacterized protein n=2 Tax=Eucalyptus grandis TaxID=71139 RepID=A0ACC3LI07_EUCGR|nr:hypothetical protein EUGRSUZ_C03105 [Eucalyptus grandis]
MSTSVFQILLLLVSLTLQASGAAPGLAKPNCPDACGDVTIPFPFGIGARCFLEEWYQIVCQQNNTVPILKKIGSRVLGISLDGMIEISLPVIYSHASCGGDGRAAGVSLKGSQFVFSQTRNVFTLVGCDTLATMDTTKSAFVGCSSRCAETNTSISQYTACSGRNGCCQTRLPLNLQHFSVDFKEEGVGAGLGALLLCLVLWGLYKYIKKRKEIKLKEKNFKRNGGLLLESELSSEGHVEKNKLFNSKDLKKATNNFNQDRILGRGGQGTVYKGMLTDGKIVAIKKSQAIDEGKVKQFINEVFILSQINHRNIVKLLGCCLETKVPLLVYEFIPNGTLYQYLHDPKEEYHVSWDTRLRIATEIAGALFYLHSAASIPIYHRDIKSTNILLDEKYRAKVADFGTFGYLDPEYFQSSQFTDKSDVYSFGVVLVELLTGQKPISSLREQEGRSLATYFIISMEENRLFDIVDAQVLKEGKKEEIASFANLAKRCLNLNGRSRPTMKEVAMELEGMRKLLDPLGIQQNQEDREATESYDVACKSSKSNIDADVITFSDVQPFSPSETG